MEILKRTAITALLLVFVQPNLNALSKNIGLTDLQDLTQTNTFSAENGKTLDKNHWAYKTLENINKKYNVNLEKSSEKFFLEKPLTRNEAAFLLISMIGKIEQNNIQLTEFEKGKMEALNQELQQEIDTLKIAVSKLATSVDTLKGSVSNLEKAKPGQVSVGFGKDFKLTGSMQGKYAGNLHKGKDNYSPNFSIPLAELGFNGNLNQHVRMVANFQPGRYYDSSSAKTMMGDLYASTNIIPHHTVYIGQTRVPIGYEGTLSNLSVDSIERAQIGRKLSNFRDLGVKVAGSWTYADYYMGAYNGSKYYSKDNNNDMDLSSWVNFKPLAKLPQYGSLTLGTGYSQGKGTQSYDVFGAFGGYKYKKLGLKYEYAMSKGLATQTNNLVAGSTTITDGLGNSIPYSISNISGRKASGWYTSASYDLTKKLQLLAKFDTYDPNRQTVNNLITEYTIGTNYFLSGNNIKLQINYVYVADQSYNNSQRIVALTQYAF